MKEDQMIQYLRTINGVLNDLELSLYRRNTIVMKMNNKMIDQIQRNLF